MALSIGLDIGGTFTDLIIFDEATGELQQAKSSTTPKRSHHRHPELPQEESV